MSDVTQNTHALIAQASRSDMVEPREIIGATFQTAMRFTQQGAKDIGGAMHSLKQTFMGMGIQLQAFETGTDEDQKILMGRAQAIKTAQEDETAAKDDLVRAEKKSFWGRASAVAKANEAIAKAEVALQEAHEAFKKAQVDIAQLQHDRIEKASLDDSVKRLRDLMKEVQKMSEDRIVLIDADLKRLVTAREQQNKKLLEYAQQIEDADTTLLTLRPELVNREADLAACKPNTQAFFQAENAVNGKKAEIRQWEATLTTARTLLPKVRESSIKNEQQQDMKHRHREGISLALAELKAVLEDEILHAESHLNGLREAFDLQAVGMSSEFMGDVDEFLAASAARFATVAEGVMLQQIEGVPGRMQRLGRMRGARDTATGTFDAAYTALQNQMIDANFLLEDAHASGRQDAARDPFEDEANEEETASA